MRSGRSSGSIYWVLLFWGRVSVSKPLSQKHGGTFLLLQDADPTPSFGGFGLSTGRWTSKLGGLEDFEHDSPSELEGVEYGQVVQYLRRSSSGGEPGP